MEISCSRFIGASVAWASFGAESCVKETEPRWFLAMLPTFLTAEKMGISFRAQLLRARQCWPSSARNEYAVQPRRGCVVLRVLTYISPSLLRCSHSRAYLHSVQDAMGRSCVGHSQNGAAALHSPRSDSPYMQTRSVCARTYCSGNYVRTQYTGYTWQRVYRSIHESLIK